MSAQKSSLFPTLWRGLRLRCPHCGERGLFRAYLKLNQACPHCGADFSNAETADVAPYVTVFLIGLIVTPLALVTTMYFHITSDLVLIAFLAGALALTLWLLPRIKGALAALLWRAGRTI